MNISYFWNWWQFPCDKKTTFNVQKYSTARMVESSYSLNPKKKSWWWPFYEHPGCNAGTSLTYYVKLIVTDWKLFLASVQRRSTGSWVCVAICLSGCKMHFPVSCVAFGCKKFIWFSTWDAPIDQLLIAIGQYSVIGRSDPTGWCTASQLNLLFSAFSLPLSSCSCG